MLVKTLDNYEYKWQLKSAAATKKSGPHLKVRELLHQLYPTAQILEEVQIQVKKNQQLYLDFYLPLYNIAIEIDGAQHREYSGHFHKNKHGFMQSQINDNLKERFCELNDITFIRLRDDKEEEWLDNLKGSI